MEKMSTIIETLKSNETVVNEINNIIAKLEKRYQASLKNFDVEEYDKAYEWGDELPYLFSVNDEANTLIDMIEDIFDFSIYRYIRTPEFDEEDEIGISSDIQYAIYIASQIVDNELLNEGHYTEDSVRFYPNEDDMYDLRGEAQLYNEFCYDLLENSECDGIYLDNYETVDGNYFGDFTLEDAENICRNAGRNLYDNWEYDEESNTLERKDIEW